MMEHNEMEKRLEALERKIDRLQAYHDVANVMAGYAINHCQKNIAHDADYFALDMPDVSVEIANGGVLVGPEAVKALYKDVYYQEEYHGKYLKHYLTTPAIEVAEDGKTARGVWYSPGWESDKLDGSEDIVPIISFGAYSADFIKTEKGWKIWHLHWYHVVKCQFEDGWVHPAKEKQEDPAGARKRHPALKNATVLDPTYQFEYNLSAIQESIPAAPLPYQTWDGDLSWPLVEAVKRNNQETTEEGS